MFEHADDGVAGSPVEHAELAQQPHRQELVPDLLAQGVAGHDDGGGGVRDLPVREDGIEGARLGGGAQADLDDAFAFASLFPECERSAKTFEGLPAPGGGRLDVEVPWIPGGRLDPCAVHPAAGEPSWVRHPQQVRDVGGIRHALSHDHAGQRPVRPRQAAAGDGADTSLADLVGLPGEGPGDLPDGISQNPAIQGQLHGQVEFEGGAAWIRSPCGRELVARDGDDLRLQRARAPCQTKPGNRIRWMDAVRPIGECGFR